MDKFTSIIDTYLSNFDNYNNGNISFECDYGELIFYKKNPKVLTLFAIYIRPEYRNQGLCRDILCYLIDSCSNSINGCNFEYFCIKSVLSNILYDYLLRFKYKNKYFVNTQKGFYCLLT